MSKCPHCGKKMGVHGCPHCGKTYVHVEKAKA